MESILGRALEYTLKYWLKSFSREQFKLQGRTVHLSNLGTTQSKIKSKFKFKFNSENPNFISPTSVLALRYRRRRLAFQRRIAAGAQCRHRQSRQAWDNSWVVIAVTDFVHFFAMLLFAIVICVFFLFFFSFRRWAMCKRSQSWCISINSIWFSRRILILMNLLVRTGEHWKFETKLVMLLLLLWLFHLFAFFVVLSFSCSSAPSTASAKGSGYGFADKVWVWLCFLWS